VSFFGGKAWKSRLSFDNFVTVVSKFETEPNERTMKKFYFCFIDANNNGFITAPEVKEFLIMYGFEGEELDSAMEFVGGYTGQDEFMDFKEFKQLYDDTNAKYFKDHARLTREVAKHRKGLAKMAVANRAKQLKKTVKSVKVFKAKQVKARKTRKARKVKASKKAKKAKKQVKRW